MAKPRYSYTFSLGPEEAEALERIAHDSHLTPTAAVKASFVDSLRLERAGLKVGDERTGIALRAFAGLKGQKLERALEFVEKL